MFALHLRNNRKGFLVPMVLVVTFVVMGLGTVMYSLVNSSKLQTTHAYKYFQSSNYAKEGIEMAKGYIQTKINSDSQNGWNNYISSLQGNYKISYGPSGYSINQADSEEIYDEKPSHVKYTRKVTIKDGDTSNEKVITSTVNFGTQADFVQYTTSITNIYGN